MFPRRGELYESLIQRQTKLGLAELVPPGSWLFLRNGKRVLEGTFDLCPALAGGGFGSGGDPGHISGGYGGALNQPRLVAKINNAVSRRGQIHKVSVIGIGRNQSPVRRRNRH